MNNFIFSLLFILVNSSSIIRLPFYRLIPQTSNINPENFRDKNGNLKYPKFIEASDDILLIIEKLMSMINEDDDLNLDDIQKFKFFNDVNFLEILERKCDSEIKPMNLDIQKINNLGVIVDNQIDEKEEQEKERYTLFNYDSDDEN